MEKPAEKLSKPEDKIIARFKVAKSRERIKLWLSTIDFSNISPASKKEIKNSILSSYTLQEADKKLEDRHYNNVELGLNFRDYINNLLGLRDELSRKRPNEKEELEVLFINLRDDIWDFWEENKKKEE